MKTNCAVGSLSQFIGMPKHSARKIGFGSLMKIKSNGNQKSAPIHKHIKGIYNHNKMEHLKYIQMKQNTHVHL